MVYEYLVEQLALVILEAREQESIRTPQQKQLMGAMKLNKDPKARASVKQAFLKTLRHPTELVYDKTGRVSRVPKALAHEYAGVAEAYLSKYSYRTPKETMASRVTVDPKTGEEKSAKTFSAKTDAQSDLTKLELVKGRVKETGKPHEVTFIGKKGPQLQPHKHREIEHKLEVKMHVGEPHIFHKGEKVQLRATGNGVHIVAPGEKNDRIVAHSGMLSSPHFGGVATSKGRREGKAAETRVQQMAAKRAKVAKKVAKRRKLSSEIRTKAAAVQGKAKKLTPTAPAAPAAKPVAPEAGKSEIGEFRSRIADIMKRMRKG
jgi:hypothetical protein